MSISIQFPASECPSSLPAPAGAAAADSATLDPFASILADAGVSQAPEVPAGPNGPAVTENKLRKGKAEKSEKTEPAGTAPSSDQVAAILALLVSPPNPPVVPVAPAKSDSASCEISFERLSAGSAVIGTDAEGFENAPQSASTSPRTAREQGTPDARACLDRGATRIDYSFVEASSPLATPAGPIESQSPEVASTVQPALVKPVKAENAGIAGGEVESPKSARRESAKVSASNSAKAAPREKSATSLQTPAKPTLTSGPAIVFPQDSKTSSLWTDGKLDSAKPLPGFDKPVVKTPPQPAETLQPAIALKLTPTPAQMMAPAPVRAVIVGIQVPDLSLSSVSAPVGMDGRGFIGNPAENVLPSRATNRPSGAILKSVETAEVFGTSMQSAPLTEIVPAAVAPVPLNRDPAPVARFETAATATIVERVVPLSTASNVAGSQPLAAPAGPVSAPSTPENDALTRAAGENSVLSGTVVPAGPLSPKKAIVDRGVAKTAASTRSHPVEERSGVYSSIATRKNNFLPAANEEVATPDGEVGTPIANRVATMSVDSRQLPASRSADAFAPQAEFTAIGAPADTVVAETQTATPAHAVEVVREIRDIADGLWALDRNSVEVRFHFGEAENLSVRLEYRDGEVRTTFRTDSPELRDTLAHEWKAQGNAVSVERPYRVADPVFSVQGAADAQMSAGGDASRQHQRSSEQPTPAQPHFPSHLFGGDSRAATAPAPLPARAIRPDTALHLHAHA